MRREDKEIRERSEIDKIINQARICRLAMIDEGEPYIVPMNFGYLDNCLYFHSASQGRKINILNTNQRVCFEMETAIEIIQGDRPCTWTTNYKSVIGTGQAEFIVDEQEKIKGLTAIVRHYSPEDREEISEEDLQSVTVFRVRIDRLSGKKSG